MKYQIAEMIEAVETVQAFQMSLFLIPFAIAAQVMTPRRHFGLVSVCGNPKK